MLERQAAAGLHDGLVHAAQSQVQEAERVEQRLRRVPERLDQHLLRDLGGARAIGVAAHAIDDHEQRGMFRNRHGAAILVVLAPTQQADIGVFDAQLVHRHSDKLRGLYTEAPPPHTR